MNAVSLERLEAEFAASLRCRPCEQGPPEDARPATHVAILRRFCAAGAPLPDQPFGREWLVCREHAAALEHGTIGDVEGERGCMACGNDVTRQTYAHIIARVVPIGLPT